MQDLKILNDFNLKVQVQITWADMDILGHVNSTKYFAYLETARIKYYEKLRLLNYFQSQRNLLISLWPFQQIQDLIQYR